jgi:[acyl-carrier-protein] S-malonyltransferase
LDISIVVLANINSPGQIVVSGHIDAVERAMRIAEAKGARKVVRLNVSGAFHSPLVASAQEELVEYITDMGGVTEKGGAQRDGRVRIIDRDR